MSSVHHIALTPGQLPRYILWCINKKITFFIHGSPGLGKSWTLRRLCQDNSLVLKDERLSQYDAVDLRGLPDQDKAINRTVWVPPDMLPSDNDPPGLLFLDEFPDANDDVKKAAYQLVLDRALGNYKIPDHWAVGAAGNMISDLSMVTRSPAALNNRFCHFYVTCEIKDWSAMAAAENIHPMVIGFLNWKPSWLHAFTSLDDGELRNLIKNSDAWYSPRTWEWVSDAVWDWCENDEPDKKLREEKFIAGFEDAKVILAGFVGLSATSEFSGYVQYYSQLPDLDDLIANPHNYKAPDLTPVQYALSSALALKVTVGNFANILKFMKKMPAEMQSSMVAAAARRDDAIVDTDEFVNWSMQNQRNIF